MIHVIAFVTTKPGQRDAILREFHQILPKVHAEKGCIEYAPAIDTEGAPGVQTKLGQDAFAVVEKWESVETLAAHLIAPHMADYRAKVKDMIATTVLSILSPA